MERYRADDYFYKEEIVRGEQLSNSISLISIGRAGSWGESEQESCPGRWIGGEDLAP